ncbi:MAG: hypothetical protein KAV87_13665 [Desulfobacteraceae bacterium]|nr:hypothetical protein [Desulfobacteraceae bacterium]
MIDRLNVKKTGDKPIPTERLFVVWGVDGPVVVFASGRGVQSEIDGDAETFAASVGAGLTDNDPDHGIWVWEGIPFEEWSPNTPDGPSEYEGLNLSGGTWRKPTEEEMNAFLSGKRAWSTS